MVFYCNGANKATVIYQFQGQDQERFTTERNLPIDVNVTQISDPNKPSNACDGWNWYRVWSGQPCSTEAFGWRCFNDLNPDSIWSITTYCGLSSSSNNISCNGIRFYKNGVLYLDSPPWFSHCKLQTNYFQFFPKKYVITVKDQNNNQIFQKIGETPVTFSVSCDDECPKGFCKCVIPGYPGYCCLDCAATAASIRSITNELRAKNGR
jgi:hypothetical protein